MKRLLVFLLFMVFPVVGMAATIHVPGDQPTIQAGIVAAVDGDTVLVAPGTYVENIDFLGKAITVISEQGPEVTIIDGGSPPDPDYGSVVTFVSSEGLDSVLNGFTLTNGTGTYYPTLGFLGGGILCDQSSSPTIIHNIITGNSVDYCGGGILCNDSSSPLIAHNTIEENESIGPPVTGGGAIFCRLDSSPTIVYNSLSNNFAAHSGGAIHCIGSCSPQISYNTISGNSTNLADSLGGAMVFYIECAPLITHNIITDNISTDSGGAIATQDSILIVANNLFAGNSATDNGGGIFCQFSTLTLENNTISGNIATLNGGGIAVVGGSSATLMNNILWGNDAPTGSEGSVGSTDTLTISYSDVEGGQGSIAIVEGSTLNWGAGNIDEDPLFCSGPLGDYYLCQDPCQPGVDNPCVDAGNPFSPMIEGTTRTDCHPDVARVDMGYHYALLDTVAADLGCVPDSGVLPFTPQISVTLGNAVAYNRRVAGRINLTLASGTTYQSWRAGYTNLGPNEMYVISWMQTLPALGSLVGGNVFELHAEDVTPSPYNQPPYPPAGDTDTCTVTVTATAP